MDKIRAVIIDDEVSNVDLIKHFISKYCAYVDCVGHAHSVDSSLTLIEKQQPQLIFLDVILGEQTCFEILENIDFNKYKIIFITAYDQYAIKALKFDALDYILKPIVIEEFLIAVNKAYEDIEKERYYVEQDHDALMKAVSDEVPFNFIAIPSMHRIDFVKLDEIIYLQSEGRYTIFHLTDGNEIVATKNLGEYEAMIQEHNFFRIHNSYIVNLSHVSSINKSGGNYCEMINKKSLPIAKRRLDSLGRYLKIKS